MNWLMLQRLLATGSNMSHRNHRRELAMLTRMALVAVVSVFMMLDGNRAYGYFGAPCSTACPTMSAGQCPTIYCKPAPSDPEISCDDWCTNFAGPGTCANCGDCSATDCAVLCEGPSANCATACDDRSGGSCLPTTCGAKGFTPPTCAASGADIPIGGPYDCCADNAVTCTCQDVDYVDSFCVGTTCTPTIMGSGTEMTGCFDCTDSVACEVNVCGPSGACEFSLYDDGASRACYTGPAGTENTGTCVAGVEVCKDGSYLPCTDVTPVPEVCDGLDNNCDTHPDNGTCTCMTGDVRACYGGPSGTQNVGECKDGSQDCVDPGVWFGCAGQVMPTAELCDNLDNDCNGDIDNYAEPCYTGPPATRGVGVCSDGLKPCTAGVFGACSGQNLPKASETCGNGLDDNCNGMTDDGCPSLPAIEVCNGLDDDMNGIVDDGAANSDCPGSQICEWGTCFDDCTLMTCMGTELCYANDFRCDDATDPCVDIACPPAMMCFSGSCFDTCASSAECDPTDELCYQSGRCALESDPCFDVQCPETQICYSGGCFDPCADSTECMTPDICLDGRCTSNACFNVDCPVGTICAGGSCFQTCSADSQCDPNSHCYNGRCAADNCEGIACPQDTSCFGGFCADSCLTTATCGAGEECYDDAINYCQDSSDPCQGVECGTTELCFAGSCFTACSTDTACGTDEVCYAGRCAHDSDPQCDGIKCPVGDECFGGNCVQACSSDDQCDPSSYCYQGACVVDSCTGVVCPSGDVCHRGVCYQGCDASKPCVAPDGCFDGRCAPSACEAQAATTILSYNTDHPFRKAKKRLRAYQPMTPWIYGRAFDAVGVDAVNWVNTAPAGLYRPKKARVVLYRDAAKGSAPGEYALYLTHGGTTTQGAAEAVYSMQFEGVNPDVLKTYPDNKEAYWVTDTNPRHISSLITTGPNQPGGVLIGHMPANSKWKIKITATLHGDLDAWQFVNGETGEVYELDPNYPLTLRSEDFSASEQLSPEIGTPCNRSGQGICQRGTYLACENSERICGQTVFPATLELCDGVDNDCDGAIDEDDPDLRVPMVYRRQGHDSGWRAWMSFDTAGTSRDLLDYTPSAGDDRLGSTEINLPGYGAIQTSVDHSHTFAHRDIRNGRITFPFIHGKQQAVSDWHTRKFEFDGWAPFGYYLDDMYVAWYEDRKPGSTGDEIVDEWYTDTVEMDLAWEVEKRDGMAETDGVVLGVDWYGVDAYFNLKWDFEGGNHHDEENNPYDWFVWSPGVGSEELQTRRSLQVRVKAARLDETACRAPTTTVSGCGIGRYTCRAGVLKCSVASDLACNTCVDVDGDGAPGFDAALCPSGTDCNDNDPTVGPGTPELCNGLDDNCDGIIDLTVIGCPNGEAQCGPSECGFISACVCPDGPEDENFDPATMEACYCGEGLKP